MPSSTPKWLASIALATLITMINVWMINHLSTQKPYGLLLAQAWSGFLVLFGLSYAAKIWPCYEGEKISNTVISVSFLHWVKIFFWIFICNTLPWLSLPGGGSLGLVAAGLFFALIWRGSNYGIKRLNFRAVILAFLFGIALVIALLWNYHWSYRLTLLVTDFSGPPDFEGRHYFYRIVLRTISGLQFFGESATQLPSNFERVNSIALLHLAHKIGFGPVAFLAAILLIFWRQAFVWLRTISSGPLLSAEIKLLGLALVALHGLATFLNILWNFGITRQPFGAGLPPLTSHAAWWVLSPFLLWIIFRSYQQFKYSKSQEIACNVGYPE